MKNAALALFVALGMSTSALAETRDAVQSPPTRAEQRTRPSNVKLNANSSEYIGPIYSKHTTPGWAVLTDPTHIERTRQIVRIAGRFNGGLKLENVTGSSNVTMVNVVFSDGSGQTIRVDRTLTGRQSAQLAVRRGELDYIVVYGATAPGGTYRILGS
jgi:hypothetical protein